MQCGRGRREEEADRARANADISLVSLRFNAMHILRDFFFLALRKKKCMRRKCRERESLYDS
jgi:hypothetical protein